jgi:hypothetical protein
MSKKIGAPSAARAFKAKNKGSAISELSANNGPTECVNENETLPTTI